MNLPRNVIDMAGKKYGRYTVLEYVGQNKDHKAVWKCQCECGTIKNVSGKELRSGKTKSCRCYIREKSLENPALWKPKHGLSNHPLHQIWRDIKMRCDNPNMENYKHYGGRGIKMCDEWKDFQAFYDWSMKNGYEKGLSIDRIDTNGNYSPENCRWASMKVQQNNRRNNKILTINGETKTMSEWADFYSMKYTVVKSRIKNGWEPIDALTIPINATAEYARRKL